MSHLLTPRPSSPSPLRPILPPSLPSALSSAMAPPYHDDLLRRSSSHHLSSSSSSLSFPAPDHSNSDDPRRLQLKHEIRLLINSNQINTATQMIHGARNSHDLNRTTMLNDGAAIIRTCSDCNTTKTPLWRSGPRGPKSLCNACGIRQRKARRAMAEAAAVNGGIPCGGKSAAIILKTNKTVQHKIMTKPAAKKLKRKRKDDVVVAGGGKKGCFEDIKIGRRLSEISSSYRRVFPQDETDAAILLMTLSYGLLLG
ncbi:GATA transcription factor 21-like isoform X2 [Cucurbita pepo subsp. pepo]|uniref:GATA transcription factor 21-like isoform X2 n=1 Tax=Cucurbita pepo subsp. pepo TaxID=3664 RepID=UPI000C9D4663|nr:GATA transcription factor 21-like isoform X2 [Cucurbita pepo subsp. pepo]